MSNTSSTPHIVIVGGGFVGVRSALDLARRLPNTSITLISNKSYLEYYPALYRVVTGSSPVSASIMLSDIFGEYPQVSVIEDTIVDVEPNKHIAVGDEGTRYEGDYLILAVGNETSYFNIEGVEEVSYIFKTVHKALYLKRRINKLFSQAEHMEDEEELLTLHFVIVGGGASGVELAGELSQYTEQLAQKHGVDSSCVTIDLIEAAPRILPRMPKRVSERVAERLRDLGVNVYQNRMLVKSQSWTVFLKDMTLGAKTLIWTAGVKTNHLYENIAECEYDGKSRVIVNDQLEAKGFPNVFIGGDNASTENSGLAQTALRHGSFIARVITAKEKGNQLPLYEPATVAHDIPVGPGWAVFVFKKFVMYGRLAWWLRHLIDLKFYLSILPFRKALRVFFGGAKKDYQRSEEHTS